MSGRSRIVAVQAVIVGILLVVVFLTLLRPDEDSRLFGIRGPGEQQIAHGPHDGDGGRPNGDAEAGDRQNGDRGGKEGPLALTGPAATTLPSTPGAPATAPTGVPAGPATPGDEGSPSDDQYSDSVARLVGRLGPGS